jgi:hypothetical protein
MKFSSKIKIFSLATMIISSSLSLGNSQAFAEPLIVGGKEVPVMDNMSIDINLNTVETLQIASGKSNSGIIKPCDRISPNSEYGCIEELSGPTQYRKYVPYRPFLVKKNQSQEVMKVYIPIRTNSN